jgi:hypothetical protein
MFITFYIYIYKHYFLYIYIYIYIYIYEEGVVKTRNLLGEGVIEVIIFGLVFIKKIIKLNFKKNRNRSETSSN